MKIGDIIIYKNETDTTSINVDLITSRQSYRNKPMTLYDIAKEAVEAKNQDGKILA